MATFTFTSFEERQTRSIQKPGAGFPLMTGYHSESVELRSTATKEAGTVTFALNPDVNIQERLRDRNGVEVTFTAVDQDPEKKQCDCDVCAVAHIPIPVGTTDAEIPTYVATLIQHHSLFPGIIDASSQTGAALTYSARHAGMRIEFSSDDLTVTQTRSQTASFEVQLHVGDGAALFYTPAHFIATGDDDLSLRRTPGVITGTTVANPFPTFFGVLRKRYKPLDFMLKCDCAPEYSQCYEAITQAPAVTVPLELPAPNPLPDFVQIYARYLSDAAINNGLVGGFQIIDGAAATPPAGMVPVPATLLYYYDNVAAIRLARL